MTQNINKSLQKSPTIFQTGLNAPLRSFNVSPFLAFYTIKGELGSA
jgi:hypothetical protein